jgi:hypothetical protein
MLVHLFGATSSPSCSNVALQRTAEDNQLSFSPDVCKMICSNFYVDDFLKSVSSEQQAKSVMTDITQLCSKGGFHLTKWFSNSREVIDAVPVEERASELKELDLRHEDLPAGHVLGINWCTETDCFKFKVVIRDMTPTRRSLLSFVSSIFDPLGFLTPVTMKAKMLLQTLCKQSIPWDEVLQGEDLVSWQRWLESIPKLEEFGIPRCVKSADIGGIRICQLHHFADASQLGYGVVSYIRLIDMNNHIHCALLMSKARVAPLKKVTIPRLELSAATLAVRMHHMIVKQLEYEVHDVCFWTDSMAVLRYIWNENSRFQTFVANRLAVIRDGSDVTQWKFVKSDDNPADDVSRSMKTDDFLCSIRWLNGPDFLRKPASEWTLQPERTSIPESDLEVKLHEYQWKSINVRDSL